MDINNIETNDKSILDLDHSLFERYKEKLFDIAWNNIKKTEVHFKLASKNNKYYYMVGNDVSPYYTYERDIYEAAKKGLLGDLPIKVDEYDELRSKYYNKEIRKLLLEKSDWTQLSDVDLPNDTRIQWTRYRKALRDITKQPSFPFEIQWPSIPAHESSRIIIKASRKHPKIFKCNLEKMI